MVGITPRPPHFRRARRAVAVLVVVLAGALGCGRASTTYGMPVGPGAGTSLAAVLPAIDAHAGEDVIVEARIAEVCPTAGCWCVLEEGGDRLHVTLTTFVLPRDVEGRRCRVAGRLAVQDDRPTLMATGLELLPD